MCDAKRFENTDINANGHSLRYGCDTSAFLGFALILTDQNIFQFIVSSSSPSLNMAVFIGYFSFLMGLGATMTGYIFTVIELDSLKVKQTQKVKQQTQWINKRRGPE